MQDSHSQWVLCDLLVLSALRLCPCELPFCYPFQSFYFVCFCATLRVQVLHGLVIAQMWRTARSKLHLDRSQADRYLLGQALRSFTNWALLLLRNSAEYLDQIHASAEMNGSKTEIAARRVRADVFKLLDELLQLEGMDRGDGELDWPQAPAQAMELILRGARSQLENVAYAQ